MPATSTAPDQNRIPAAAKMLETSERFMRRLVAERRIRYYKNGTHVRFDPVDVVAYKIANRVEPTAVPLPVPVRPEHR